MRKRVLLAVFIPIVSCINSFGQPANPKPESFENLKLNSPPAFVLLGVDPDNIQRPSSPTELVAGVQNAIIDGKLQPNLAFEVSPYYLKHPTNPASKRFDPVSLMLGKKKALATMYQSLSLSFASSATDKEVFGNLEPGTGVGLGFRTTIINGKPGTLLKKWWDVWLESLFIAKLSATIASAPAATISDLGAIIDNVFDNVFVSEVIPAQSLNTLSSKELANFRRNIRQKILSEVQLKGSLTDKTVINTYLNDLKSTYQQRNSDALLAVNTSVTPLAKQGFILELAAGKSYVFQENTFDNATAAKTAIWLTPSYRWDVSKDHKKVSLLDLMGVIRYTFNNQSAGVDVADYLDSGIKGAFTYDRWSTSIEGVYRHASKTPADVKKDYTYRLTLGSDYKISDMITFKINFGTNFDGNTRSFDEPKKAFIIGGIQVGLPGYKVGK